MHTTRSSFLTAAAFLCLWVSNSFASSNWCSIALAKESRPVPPSAILVETFRHLEHPSLEVSIVAVKDASVADTLKDLEAVVIKKVGWIPRKRNRIIAYGLALFGSIAGYGSSYLESGSNAAWAVRFAVFVSGLAGIIVGFNGFGRNSELAKTSWWQSFVDEHGKANALLNVVIATTHPDVVKHELETAGFLTSRE